MLLLIPWHRQKVKSSKQPAKLVRCWSPERQLWCCFACTDWDVLHAAGHFHEKNKTKTAIKKLRKEKKISSFVRKKRTIPGCQVQNEICSLYTAATKLEEQIATNDTRFIWKKLQNITNYKKKSTPTTDGDNHLPDILNTLWEVWAGGSITISPQTLSPHPFAPYTRRRTLKK